MSESVRDKFHRAIALHHQGNLKEAQALYEDVMRLTENQPDVAYLLGTLCLQKGEFTESIQLLEQVAKSDKASTDVLNNLGIAYKAVSRLDDAAGAFKQAIQTDANYPQAYFNLGQLLEQQERLPEAELCYRKAVELQPDDGESCWAWASLLLRTERWSEAEQAWRQCLTQTPDQLDALVSLGFALTKQEKHSEAEASFHRVLEQKPDYYQVINNLSFLAERQGNVKDAIDFARQALKIQPDYVDAWNNLGISLRSDHRLEEALEAFENALKIQPVFPLAEFNRATTTMLGGNYQAGWKGYERRFQIGADALPGATQPRWNGDAIPGKTLLVYADQGFGDAIQFARFLPRIVMDSKARVIFRCPKELVRLMQWSFGKPPEDGGLGIDAISEEVPIPTHEFQLPLLSSGLIWNLGVDDVAMQEPYLCVDRQAESAIDPILPSDSEKTKPRVGICWQGNPGQARDIVRSLSFDVLKPILERDDCEFFSLQFDAVGRQQLASFQSANRTADVGGVVTDFADTALAISRLDAVVTVDTAVAHLAGALGAHVITMVCHTPDWRWHLERNDSPWYSTMKLARQPTWGDWDVVIDDVQKELQSLSER